MLPRSRPERRRTLPPALGERIATGRRLAWATPLSAEVRVEGVAKSLPRPIATSPGHYNGPPISAKERMMIRNTFDKGPEGWCSYAPIPHGLTLGEPNLCRVQQ